MGDGPGPIDAWMEQTLKRVEKITVRKDWLKIKTTIAFAATSSSVSFYQLTEAGGLRGDVVLQLNVCTSVHNKCIKLHAILPPIRSFVEIDFS